MTSKRKLYREDEKLFFLHSYYQSGMSKHAFCRAHGICCPALLNSWIKKYSNLAEELSLPSEQESPDMSNRSKEAYKDENAQLKKRIKELEKALNSVPFILHLVSIIFVPRTKTKVSWNIHFRNSNIVRNAVQPISKFITRSRSSAPTAVSSTTSTPLLPPSP